MRGLLVGSICLALSPGCQDRGLPIGRPPPTDRPIRALACEDQAFEFAREPPNVMLVLDRSVSMSDPIATNSPTTKLDDLRGAIAPLLNRYDSAMRFGATFFAGDGDCAPGVVGEIAPQNGWSIQHQLAATTPGGNTPTATTLDAVIRSHQLADPTRANYLVLATDGMPNCDDVDVTRRIETLHAAGVRTFVIGIGPDTDSDPALLNAWADAGGTARTGDRHYYQTDSSMALDAAFDAVAADIANCDFKLSHPPDAHHLEVSELGQPVEQSATAGWTFDEATQTLTLHGPACDAVESGAKVSVVYTCPTVGR